MPTSVTNLATRQATGRPQGTTGVNVGETERLISAVGGGLLALYGLTTRGPAQLLLPLLGGALVYRGLSGHCAGYAALGMNTACASGQDHTAIEAGHGVKVEHSVTIDRPADELYRQWRDFSRLPRFMRHLEEVRVKDSTHSHWVAKAPLGLRVEWDAEVITDKPGEVIGWRSLPGADVDTAGSVHFVSAGQGRGTEVRVVLKYDPPAGKIGATIANWLGESPETQVLEDLQRFKQMMESGQASGRELAGAGAR